MGIDVLILMFLYLIVHLSTLGGVKLLDPGQTSSQSDSQTLMEKEALARRHPDQVATH